MKTMTLLFIKMRWLLTALFIIFALVAAGGSDYADTTNTDYGWEGITWIAWTVLVGALAVWSTLLDEERKSNR